MNEKNLDYQNIPDPQITKEETVGAINSEMNIGAAQTHYDKFNASQGHGFAAEQANNLYDVLTGNEAAIVGGDNAKNGADRCVNNTYIQTKYCHNASSTVAAAFEQGEYRYINPDGSLMQLEVPYDQYDKAVEFMEKRIINGEVPGVNDPAEAKSIVRRGHFTYEQSVNIAKFGTIESITYDAVNGTIIAANAFGITAALTLARSLWNGDSLDIAVEQAVYSGVQIGGAAFISSIVSAQLMRTFVNSALTAPSEAIVSLIGKNSSQSLASALRSGANVYGITAMNGADKLIQGNILAASVMTLVLSAGDIRNAFQGKISGKQLFKNMTIRAGSMTGAAIGAQLGIYALNLVAPGAGGAVTLIVSVAGSVAGGAAGGAVTSTVVGHFIEDDAVEMVRIIEETFCKLAQEYLLNEEEADIILSDLLRSLEGAALLDMFASSDRQSFADELVRSAIERLTRFRCRIILPSEEDLLRGLGRLIEDAASGKGIFAAQTKKVDPVVIGYELTGQKLPEHAAKKAWYSTRQMNMVQSQSELLLKRMAESEKKTNAALGSIYQERDEMKAELKKILEGL